MSTTAATARIVPLEWDSAHFGVRVERLEGGARGVGPALVESAAGGVRLVIARVDARQLATVHELEAHGFRPSGELPAGSFHYALLYAK